MVMPSFRLPEGNRGITNDRRKKMAGRLSRPVFNLHYLGLLALAASGLNLTTIAARAEPSWQLETMVVPRGVKAVERVDGRVLISNGHEWFRFLVGNRLEKVEAPRREPPPAGALPDARVARGRAVVARAWFGEPTTRYAHAVLGDAIEAGSLIIERRDGKRGIVRLGKDAVFEDIEPRIVNLGGAERILAIKSYLAKGSAIAVIDPLSFSIIAETAPIGHGNAWNNIAGVADFDGDGATDIAVIRQPHAVGRLELWSWRQGRLRKTAEVAGLTNHVIASRALDMSYVAAFDVDTRPDLAIPSFDRRSLRILSFAPAPRELASIALPSRVMTNFGFIADNGRQILIMGLEDGRLAVITHR